MTSSGGRKLPGKTEWAGTRRPVTRRAGFNATAPVQLSRSNLDGYQLAAGQTLTYHFLLPPTEAGQWCGFGGWFAADRGIAVSLAWVGNRVLTQFEAPNWNKVGSLVLGPRHESEAILRFTATATGVVTTYGMRAGGVAHRHLTNARVGLIGNMWSFAPEANFYDPDLPGTVEVGGIGLRRVPGRELTTKSCNRCGRFLPINTVDERAHLSYSSHCTAAHRRPCQHSSFGKISDRETGLVTAFDYGFQLECRFCKKFEVNGAHNPQRTSGQMKEDGARRRHFELLLEHLYGGSPQLRYKNETGRDLASDIYRKFDGRCFKCGTAFASERDMHLDHTRPLALLWPLDRTATALCATHNSEKRDRPPAEFYTSDELRRLAQITQLPLPELEDPTPNMEAISRLRKELYWLHNSFLQRPELTKSRDGKVTADLVVKALNKVLGRVPGGPPFQV